MQTVLIVVALAAVANVLCIFSFERAEKAIRDFGSLWVRMLARRRPSSSSA